MNDIKEALDRGFAFEGLNKNLKDKNILSDVFAENVDFFTEKFTKKPQC